MPSVMYATGENYKSSMNTERELYFDLYRRYCSANCESV